MPKLRKTLEDEIEEFVDVWDAQTLIKLFEFIYPLFKLYDVTESDDWLEEILKDKEDVKNVRICRTVYLLSFMCDVFASKMVSTNVKFKNLHHRMEQLMEELKNG
jgi:hypothetical protein